MMFARPQSKKWLARGFALRSPKAKPTSKRWSWTGPPGVFGRATVLVPEQGHARHAWIAEDGAATARRISGTHQSKSLCQRAQQGSVQRRDTGCYSVRDVACGY